MFGVFRLRSEEFATLNITKAMKWVARAFAVALLLTATGIKAQKDEVVHDENVYLSDFAELEYPVLARQAHVEGVVVRVQLDSKGDVISSTPIS